MLMRDIDKELEELSAWRANKETERKAREDQHRRMEEEFEKRYREERENDIEKDLEEEMANYVGLQKKYNEGLEKFEAVKHK